MVRADGYNRLPMVRMTNTYLLPGADDPDEIIRQTPHGLYCVALGGGQVNTATGEATASDQKVPPAQRALGLARGGRRRPRRVHSTLCSPLFFSRIGVDPAISSGPIVTSFNDFLSMTIYFVIAWGVSTLFF